MTSWSSPTPGRPGPRTPSNCLLENYADPSVGGAGGDLVVEEAPGVMAGVGLYWRFEKWLRQTESRLHSSVGLTGAICSVRRELFRPIPPGPSSTTSTGRFAW